MLKGMGAAAGSPSTPSEGWREGRLLGVQVGCVRALQVGPRRVTSAIAKTSVTGAVAVGPLGLAGDEQADPSVHGGLTKAVYAYPVEHLALWQEARRGFDVPGWDIPMAPGMLGENLLIEGLQEREVWVGDRLHLPDCVLRVTAPREPCHKFTAVMGFAQAARWMLTHRACGFYLAVERPGTLQAGQAFALQPGPRALSIADALWARRLKALR